MTNYDKAFCFIVYISCNVEIRTISPVWGLRNRGRRKLPFDLLWCRLPNFPKRRLLNFSGLWTVTCCKKKILIKKSWISINILNDVYFTLFPCLMVERQKRRQWRYHESPHYSTEITTKRLLREGRIIFHQRENTKGKLNIDIYLS